MYLVTKRFIDKDNNKQYSIDSIYRSNDEERIEELRKLGFIGVELTPKEVQKEEIPEEIKAEEVIREESKEETEKKSSKKK